MNIWFDLSNSPHVNMFYDLIKDLEKLGHNIIITCRPLANTIDLLEQRKLSYTVIGKHYGKSFFKKVLGYPIRVLQLKRYLTCKNIDLAISQSSFHSPLVARLLGVPSIYTNDNEHALGNICCYALATKIFIPESLNIKSVIKWGAKKKNIFQYPGVKEGLYLWKKGKVIHYCRNQNKTSSKIRIYVRPEPVTAQYYSGALNFMDSILEELQTKYTITVLSRTTSQNAYYRQHRFSSINVPSQPLEFNDIAIDCTLFIGAGGSMTRELAILGIPTISVYQDKLLNVDKFLIKRNLLKHIPNLSTIEVIDYINSVVDKQPDLELMTKGELAYEAFKSEILNFDLEKK